MKGRGVGLFAFAVGVLCLAVEAQAADPVKIDWTQDIKRAAEVAKETGRPMVIFVTMDGCGYCTQMKQTTFRDSNLAKELNDEFVPTYVNQAQNRQWIQRLNIRSFPTTLFATPDGMIRDRASGYLSANTLRERMQKIQDQPSAQ